MRASVPALRTEAEGATTRQLVERPGAAVMVVKKQGSCLVQMKFRRLSSRSGAFLEVQRRAHFAVWSYQKISAYFLAQCQLMSLL